MDRIRERDSSKSQISRRVESFAGCVHDKRDTPANVHAQLFEIWRVAFMGDRTWERLKCSSWNRSRIRSGVESSLNNCAFLAGDKTGHRNEEEEEEKSALITGIVFNRADYSPTFC